MDEEWRWPWEVFTSAIDLSALDLRERLFIVMEAFLVSLRFSEAPSDFAERELEAGEEAS